MSTPHDAYLAGEAEANKLYEATQERVYQQTYGRDRRTTAEKIRDEDFKRAAIDFLSTDNTILGGLDPHKHSDAERINDHYAEGNKRMRDAVNAMPMGTPPNPANPLSKQIDGGHYKDLKIQPIEYIHANNIPFAEGCAIKYLTRWRSKGGVKDLEKAKHFIELLIELESRNDNV